MSTQVRGSQVVLSQDGSGIPQGKLNLSEKCETLSWREDSASWRRINRTGA